MTSFSNMIIIDCIYATISIKMQIGQALPDHTSLAGLCGLMPFNFAQLARR